MIDTLLEEIRLRELRNPENREAINAYKTAENQRLNEFVYSPAYKKFPSLKKIRNEIVDPIKIIENHRTVNRDNSVLREFARILKPEKEDIQIQEIIEMSRLSNPFIEKSEAFALLNEEYIINLAHSVRKFSYQNNFEFQEAVSKIEYLDEISRLTMPTRTQAEEFMMQKLIYERELTQTAKHFIKFKNKTSLTDKIDPQEIPSSRALNALFEMTIRYNLNEFDRIYSTN